jgi:hypothetical protein
MMDLSIMHKFGVITLVIIFLTLFIIKLFLNKNRAFIIHNEMSKLVFRPRANIDDCDDFGFEPYTVKENFTNVIEGLDIMRDIKRAFEKPFKKLKDELEKPINDVKDAFMDPINKIISFVERVKTQFEKIPFKKVDQGIKLEFVNIGLSLKKGFEDVFDLVGTVGNCGINTIKNIRTCMIWYIIDLIGSTLYNIIIVLPIFIVRNVIGFDLQPFVDMIHTYIEKLDSYLQYFTCSKDKFFHFPKWVIKLCYTCEFDSQIKAIKNDWTQTIPNLMEEPNKLFREAGDDFRAVWEK